MAHPCCICGSECYCHGDIDDVIVSNTPKNCESCGCDDDSHNDDDSDIEDDDSDIEPEYFQCLGCGWAGDFYPGTNCPRCEGATIDGVY